MSSASSISSGSSPDSTTTGHTALTAKGWQIYSSMPGAEDAAARLNVAADRALAMLADEVRKGATIPTAVSVAYAYLYGALRQEREFGATDTEPDYIAQQMIARRATDVFGVPITGTVCDALWRIDRI